MISEQYRKLFGFLRSRFRFFVLATAAAFFALTLVGWLIGSLLPEQTVSITQAFVKSVEQSGVIQADGTISAPALFWHNLIAMFSMTVSGAIPFLFFPAVHLTSNSFLIGIVAALYSKSGLSPVLFLAGLIPHGIFEIPAMVLSIACGFYLCADLCRRILRRGNTPAFSLVIGNIVRVMFLITTPLVVLAAITETYVTPYLQALFI